MSEPRSGPETSPGGASGRVTYLWTGGSADLDTAFETALAELEPTLGELTACSIGGARGSAAGPPFEVRSPIDTRVVVGRAERADAADVDAAVRSAAAAFAGWSRRDWEERVAILRRAAERIDDRRLRLAAVMAWEVGKNRIEAAAEVAESADLLRYYAGLVEENGGFRRSLARLVESEATETVLRPYGAWGVIAPFNFPSALAAGMIGAALVCGNTVVFKPSRDAPLSGALLCDALWEAGVPREVLHLLIGSGGDVGEALLRHRDLAGVAFTGSHQVGMRVHRSFARDWPRPLVLEMGGKNAAIVTASADLDAAAEGIARSAFGFGGQKCSACSRAYAATAVAAELRDRLVAWAGRLRLGNPLERDVFLGPLIHERAAAKFETYVDGIRGAGGEILCGGRRHRDGDRAHGHYAEATVATLPDPAHPYFDEEMFAPILLFQPVAGLEEAIALANRSRYGLTAGLFSGERGEIERFLDGIEAGVLYVNRRSGATTGAWPGVNPFGGWKASGSTGPAALGPWYLLKFMREQSRAVTG